MTNILITGWGIDIDLQNAYYMGMAYKTISKECKNCSIIFVKFASEKKPPIFCSLKCSRNYQRGPNHPRWQAGPTNTSFQRKYEPWTPENWNDGYIDNRGYFRVYRPDYPKHYNEGYAKRYHVVWWLKTGESLPNGYVLHHKNGNKLDDGFQNLELIGHNQHSQEHNQTRIEAARVTCYCRRCHKQFFLARFRINDGRGKYCSQKCYQAGPHKQFHEIYEERTCLWCKNTFVAKKSVLKHTPGRYCSTKCSTRHTIKLRWAVRKLRSNI